MDFFGPPLSWAAWNGSFELVDFLINEGADVTAHQNTALRMAALHRQLLIVQRLLSAGADPLAIETTE
jgi:ankyrin repeat protein